MRTIIILLLFLIISPAYCQDLLPVNSIEISIVSKHTIAKMKQIKNYQFLLVKREWVDGRDTGYQYMDVKVQVKPLKVYLKFLKPRRLAGREALYIDGELVVRRGGTRLSNMVLHLLPTSPLAMEGNKYPITHINPTTVCEELIAKIAKEVKFKDTRVFKRIDIKIYNQPGVHYKLIHNVEEPDMECMTAELVVSTKLGIPIYFKVVDWKSRTIEEYAFQSMKVDVEFEPEEFLETNKRYGFHDN